MSALPNIPPHTIHNPQHTHTTQQPLQDGDGKIGSTELKGVLNAVHLGMVAALIPDGKDLDYRSLLSKVTG